MAIPYGQMEYQKIENIRVAFDILSDGKKAHIGQQFLKFNTVHVINMEDFRCKARLVTGGQATMKYANVVFRDTVTITLMIATLNDIEDKLGDILNAYAKAPVTEKVCTTLDPEFG